MTIMHYMMLIYVVAILQYIHTSSHYVVYLGLMQCYMSTISQ